jgi:transposase InsO family protein
MPWEERSTMSLRQEFVSLAQAEGANRRLLCRRFGISPKTGYKWLARVQAEGLTGLVDHSRRPRTSPRQTAAAREEQLVGVRTAHPVWGARKIRRYLAERGVSELPAPSTITTILQRHGQLDPVRSARQRPLQRFVHAAPNQLWQMDFKGHFALQTGRCHPLTVLDDHSRFALGLVACPDEQGPTVQAQLTAIFRRYGLPERMLMDNGAPWGAPHGHHRWTPLTVWLLHLGIAVSHGRPYHPETQGKDERFHRTFAAEVLAAHVLLDLAHAQRVFDAWRAEYNGIRPHAALGLDVPIQHYQPSPRAFPPTLPSLDYPSTDQVRRVQAGGIVLLHGRNHRVGDAFVGYRVGLRPTPTDGVWDLYFGVHPIMSLDERSLEMLA